MNRKKELFRLCENFAYLDPGHKNDLLNYLESFFRVLECTEKQSPFSQQIFIQGNVHQKEQHSVKYIFHRYG